MVDSCAIVCLLILICLSSVHPIHLYVFLQSFYVGLSSLRLLHYIYMYLSLSPFPLLVFLLPSCIDLSLSDCFFPIFSFYLDFLLLSSISSLSGIVERSVQPGETVDLILAGVNVVPELSVRIYKDTAGTGICGAGGMTQSKNLTFKDQAAHALPQYSIEEGAVSRLIWKDLKISNLASGTYLVCACNYWYFGASLWNGAACSRDSHFGLHIGSINIAGKL